MLPVSSMAVLSTRCVCACVRVCVVFWFVDVLSVCVFFPVLGARMGVSVGDVCAWISLSPPPPPPSLAFHLSVSFGYLLHRCTYTTERERERERERDAHT